MTAQVFDIPPSGKKYADAVRTGGIAVIGAEMMARMREDKRPPIVRFRGEFMPGGYGHIRVLEYVPLNPIARWFALLRWTICGRKTDVKFPPAGQESLMIFKKEFRA